MNDDAKHMIAAYQRVFQRLPWQAFPSDERMMYTDDDAIIRDALWRLRQLDPTTPLPGVFESATKDLNYVMVGYEQQLVLYWFTYLIQEQHLCSRNNVLFKHKYNDSNEPPSQAIKEPNHEPTIYL